MYQRSPMRYAHANGYTNVTYSQTGNCIITCGADGDIRKWGGINDDDPTSHCLGEFVLCIAHHGKELLASTDLNTVQAYTFPEIERDGTRMRFTALVTCIQESREYIAAGSEDTMIKVLKRDTQKEFLLQGHEGPVLSLDISCNDQLASVAGDGTLKVWALDTMKEIKTITGLPKVKSFEQAECFTTPTFHPVHGNAMAYVNGKEVVVVDTSTWEVILTFTDDLVTGNYSCCRFSNDGQLLAAATITGQLSIFDFNRKQKLNCETSSSECSSITCLSWNPDNSKELAFCDNTGQLGTLFFSAASADKMLFNEELLENDDVERNFDFIEDEVDDDGVSLEKLKNETLKAFTGKHHEENIESKGARSRSSISESEGRSIQTVHKQQHPFQPSSTPSDLEHRYLVWNNVGIVTAHHDATGDGAIDVEFHDASVHHSLHIPNFNNNYTLASLSSTVLALTGINASKLTCIAIATSGNKEWSTEMPDCEGVQALVCSSKFVGVVTDMRFLRLFSVMGSQREVISIPGEVLAMAGFNDRLIVCYHSGPAYNDQHLSAILLQFIGMTLRSREIRIPLPAGRKMAWLGYSDCGSPVFTDNMGLVQLYSMKTNLWYPICDTMKHSSSVSNSFFIIDVSERNQIIQAVVCRGCSYPMTNPRPIVTELGMQLPLCDLDTEKSQLEDLLVRSCNFASDDAEKTIKETAIKLFAGACRIELEMRAKELIEMIASPKLVPLAEKFASKLGRIHLSDKLKELLPKLEEQSNDRENEIKAMEIDALNIIEGSPLNAGLLLMQSKSIKETPSGKLVPKTMVLSNQKRNPFKRLSVQSNLLEKKMELDLDLNFQTTGILSPSIKNSDIDSSFLGQENAKEKKGFTPWYAENKKQLEEKHPDISAEDLIKIGMREFKEISRTHVADQTNPFASKRKISEVYPKEGSEEWQQRGSIAGKLAKYEYNK